MRTLSSPHATGIREEPGLGFAIPYAADGDEREYVPDFIAVFERGGEAPIRLLLAATGEKRRDKEAKGTTAKDRWILAANAYGGLGRWAFVEINDHCAALETIRNAVRSSTYLVKTGAR